MKTVHKAMALALVTSLAAPRAEAHGSDSGLVVLDILLNLFTLGVEVAAIDAMSKAPPPPDAATPPPPPREGYAQRAPDDDGPPRSGYAVRRRFESRQGLLMSFG